MNDTFILLYFNFIADPTDGLVIYSRQIINFLVPIHLLWNPLDAPMHISYSFSVHGLFDTDINLKVKLFDSCVGKLYHSHLAKHRCEFFSTQKLLRDGSYSH